MELDLNAHPLMILEGRLGILICREACALAGQQPSPTVACAIRTSVRRDGRCRLLKVV
ncbi:hypothetical protein ACIA5D_27065 [Actinoplanes sp. NPDC051513]|uniref:hypothetical protein n=1 Tax=Actinoplanes sp. NPDC051513 TaxID=3363908 RepID=UPI00378E1452